jgi:hypothetical protein
MIKETNQPRKNPLISGLREYGCKRRGCMGVTYYVILNIEFISKTVSVSS